VFLQGREASPEDEKEIPKKKIQLEGNKRK